jgi:hypothetical protein
MKYIKLEHELVAARWEDETGKWLLKIRSHGTNEIEDTADVLLLATGILNRWQWPQIEGLSDFQGILLHSANWKGDTDEWKDKTVGVIGAVSVARVPSSLWCSTTRDVHVLGLIRHSNCSCSATESETGRQLCSFENVARTSLGTSPFE